MKTVTKAGQKFSHNGKVYTVRGFYGDSFIEFTSLKRAKRRNPRGSAIIVVNVETGGITNLEESYLI